MAVYKVRNRFTARVTITAAVLAGLLSCVGPSAAFAQQMPDMPGMQHEQPAAAPGSWSWTTDGEIFFGFNDQEREFTDFRVWESQNWFMLAGERSIGPGRLTLQGMTSLEPFTMGALGSPQVFQTGEAYKSSPLIDRQHPHDLLMNLGATYRIADGRMAYILSTSLVGSPALGPTPFMHRESARNNPQAPLTHHYLDSTHETPGVVTGAIDVGDVTIEASSFRGLEPDYNRLNINRPWLDSWSIRGGWHHGPWRAQVSGGRLKAPEWFEPRDLPRLTASIEFAGSVHAHALAATAAWGENREVHGILDGYLLEWDVQTTARGAFYGRAESAAKDLLDLGGPDPTGFIEFHRISHIAALTLGYTYDIPRVTHGRLGIGADATVYHVAENMLAYYGSPSSFHVFLRWRPRANSMAHMH